jgi:hypothetical protein
MNELERMCADVRPPSPQAVDEGRRRLLAETRTPRTVRRPRSRVRLVALAALTAAIVIGTTIAQNLGGSDEKGHPRPVIPGPVANAEEVLNRAASAAERRPTPRPDQWIFLEDKQRFPAIGTGTITPHTPLVTFEHRNWGRVDGQAFAELDKKPMGDGKLRVTPGGGAWKHNYQTLSTMPTDPALLPAWVHEKNHDRPDGAAAQRAADLFEQYMAVLRNGMAPPRAEATIFRAIKQIPGVTLGKDRVKVGHRQAVTVALVIEGYLHEEILIDAENYRYLGERIIAIKDHTSKALDGSTTVKKGAVENLQIRVGYGIVDKPGQVP